MRKIILKSQTRILASFAWTLVILEIILLGRDYRYYKNDTESLEYIQETYNHIPFSDQEFATEFCGEINNIFLSSNKNYMKEVKARLNALKEDCMGVAELEKRFIYTLSMCGIACYESGHIYEASELTEEALALAKEQGNCVENYVLTSCCYLNSAIILTQQNQRLKAEDYYLRAVNLFEEYNDLYNSNLIVLYTDLANHYYDGANYARALSYQEKAIDILNYYNQDNSIEMGIGHLMMARIYKYMNPELRYPELISALKILESNKPESDKYLMTLYGDLGLYYWDTDKDKAQKYINKVYELGMKLEGELGDNTINAEINLAYIYSEYGQTQEALNILESVVCKCKEVYGENGVGCINAYVELAVAYGELQKYRDAIQLFDRALYICEENYGPTHPDMAYIYGNKANILMRMGQEQEVIKCIDKGIAILNMRGYTDQVDMAVLLENKAAYLKNMQGDLGEIIQLLEQARRIYKEIYGEDSDYVKNVDFEMKDSYANMTRR